MTVSADSKTRAVHGMVFLLEHASFLTDRFDTRRVDVVSKRGAPEVAHQSISDINGHASPDLTAPCPPADRNPSPRVRRAHGLDRADDLEVRGRRAMSADVPDLSCILGGDAFRLPHARVSSSLNA